MAIPKPETSKEAATNLPDAQSLSELQMFCFPGGERAYRVGRGVRAPKATHAPDPEYSQATRQKKLQGTVALALIVDQSGKPSTIIVTQSFGHGLDEKALDAVRTWAFNPATFQGQPVPVGINVHFNFLPY
jgi:protein TonB